MHTPHRTGRVTLGAFTALFAATVGGVIGGTSAQAASTIGSDQPDAAGYSCWLEVDTGNSLCVEGGVDLVAAVESETGVVLDLPEGVTIGGDPAGSSAGGSGSSEGGAGPSASGAGSSAGESTGSDAAHDDSAARASTVISTIYADAGYAGASYTMSTASGGCSYGYANLTAIGWHDRASSFRSFNGCTTALFANENYTGTRVGYTTNASSLGAMNDKADSWRVQ